MTKAIARPFGVVPVDLLADRPSKGALMVYIALASFQGTSEECWPSRDEIFKRSGMVSMDTYYKGLHWLEGKGWIVRRQRGLGKTNIYCVMGAFDDPDIPENVTSEEPESGISLYIQKQHKKKTTEADEVLDYLKVVTSKNFGRNGYRDSHRKLIIGRLNEGFTVDDCKAVIDFKAEEWMGTKMERHLNFETLFRPSNFDKYLCSIPEKEAKKAAELEVLL